LKDKITSIEEEMLICYKDPKINFANQEENEELADVVRYDCMQLMM
jgi:hypothetical protein